MQTVLTPDEGTGRGPAIAFDIAKGHDGGLAVGSSDLGGACFTLGLQAAPRQTPRVRGKGRWPGWPSPALLVCGWPAPDFRHAWIAEAR